MCPTVENKGLSISFMKAWKTKDGCFGLLEGCCCLNICWVFDSLTHDGSAFWWLCLPRPGLPPVPINKPSPPYNYPYSSGSLVTFKTFVQCILIDPSHQPLISCVHFSYPSLYLTFSSALSDIDSYRLVSTQSLPQS